VSPRGLAVAVLLVLAAACSPASATPEARTIEIEIHYSRFDPGTVDVRRGETVRFVIANADPIDHEFIVGDEAVQNAHELGTESYHPPRPGEVTIPAGETVETTYTFDGGNLIIGCHLPGHYDYGMRGLVVVGL
jgi:uncharacterized cupredoxin-like copper-binding protein